ncbi:MAG: enoyl-CoA hydratase/isomerase family protein [Deltaproteobacteria bacterium]|nr:enoyl-CoA hydratase/isomerase family protein [Deltaproteobacteria bacterium]
MAERLLVERQVHRLNLTLNRPDRRNALDSGLVAALTAQLEAADADRDIRLIVLTGAGKRAFCAGGDLASDMGQGGAGETIRAFGALMQKMSELGTPLLARVNGHCVGGGVGLMLGCDLAVAADDVKLGTPEVRSGVFPMLIAPWIVRHIGPKRAYELFFTGQRIPASQALDWGLVNRVVPRAELDDTVDELAEQLLSVSPSAVRIGRKALARTRHLCLADATPILAEALVELLCTADAAEGISSFLEKRKPEWKNR